MKKIPLLFSLTAFAALPGFAKAKINQCEVFNYDTPDKSPVWFGGESRAENVEGGGQYCIFIDIYYADGTQTWAKQAQFPIGTHDWVRSENVFIPHKPVKKIHFYRMLRRTSGKAEFRNAFLRREIPPEGYVFGERRYSMRPFRVADRLEKSVYKGGKTVQEFEETDSTFSFPSLPSGTIDVWTADSAVRVSPAILPTVRERKIELELAGAESESAQLCVSAAEDVKSASIEVSAGRLVSKDGTEFPGKVKIERIGWFARRGESQKNPWSPDVRELWFPEPILPLEGFMSAPGGTQAAWITFTAERGAKRGVYSGNVTVKVGERKPLSVPVRIKVRGFSLPERFGMKTAYCIMDGFLDAAYPGELAKRRREGWDIMLDHRLNPNDISRTTPPEIEDVEYAVSRGMNSFVIANIVPPPKNPKAKWVCRAKPWEVFNENFYNNFVSRMRPYVEQLRAKGLDRYAMFYGFDECGMEYFEKMREQWLRLKKDLGIPVMTTAYMFRNVVRHNLDFDSPCATMTDVHCPPMVDYDPLLADRYRAMGRDVWWYTCCSPMYPYANNASYEHAVVECRLLGWLTKLVRADGYLYWHVNHWLHTENKLNEQDSFFPEWRTDTWPMMPGDGVFIYPGKKKLVSSIRLANIRDGVEDYEWMLLAEKRIGRNAVEDMLREVATSAKKFSRDPSFLRRIRSKLADAIEQGRKHTLTKNLP